MSLNQPFTQIPSVKVLINVGALLDIPTGTYHKGIHRESILNGGLGGVTGVVGIGNNFKSTILHYMMLSAAERIDCMSETSMGTYDTETNIHESHLSSFLKRFPGLDKPDIFLNGKWNVTDKVQYHANEWYEVLRDFLKSKQKDVKKHMRKTPFLNRDNVTLLEIPTPTFGEVDSLTMFEPENVAKMQEEHELGDSGANTIHMRQGAAKTRFLMELPGLCGAAYHYMLITAHVGKKIEMASGPMGPAPTKHLQYLKNGDVIKGVTEKFFFLMNCCYNSYNAAPLINQGTKATEYPRNPNDNLRLDTDLNEVTLRVLRSKAGPSGMTIPLIVSQSEGVLPSLTEFHYLRESKGYGMQGAEFKILDLLPDVKVSRNTVRSKIDALPELRRALTITAEMLQMTELWHHLEEGLLCTPKELYDDLKALGFDWNVLLATRGWWTLDNDKHPIPYLSTMCLLRMRLPKDHKNHYFPYWMNDDKTLKVIKK